MKRLITILCLLLATPCLADVTYHGTTGQTLYVRVQTGASTFEGVAMTEGSSGGLGVYRTADSALVSAGVTTPSAVAGFPGGYPFTIRSGAASDTANDTILASGQLIWSGQGELPSNDVIWRSTVSSVISQTDLELAAIPNGVTWLGYTILVRDASVAGATMTGTVTGVATGAVQFAAHGSAPFTIATSDIVEILPPAYGSSDRSVDTAIKTKTDYLPSATAGASGGLLISGSNSGTTTLAALTITGTTTMSDGLVVNRSSGNSHAVALTGSGIGNGLRITGGNGATGTALNILSGSTNGNAITATGTGTGAGAAFISGSGATGDGVSMTAASTNGSGLTLTRTGTGDDLYLTNSDTTTLGAAIWGYATRNLSGTINDFDELISSASTFDTIVGSSTEWARATAPVLNGTTIATLASQTSFTLTAGSADNDAYNGGTAIFVDASTAVQKGVSVIDDYTGSTKTVTLAAAPPFTIATSDKIYIVAPMGLPAATVTDVSSGTSVSAFLVDADHTWTFASRSQTTSPQLVTELRGTDGFNGLVAMDFTVPMPANAVISSIGTVSVADESGKTEPTLSAASLSPDKKKVHVPVNATSATAGTYTISVTITTTDSQTFMRKGRLVLE